VLHVTRQAFPESDGYVADVPYVPSFIREQAPAWLDHVALVSGTEPPDRREGFAWCDLGCGFGQTAAIFAATHPDGRFYGIDMMSAHIDHARRLAAACAIANVDYRVADFAAACEMELPRFDYITVHGVYSWVSAESRATLRAFIDRHLKPGGLVYLSYNALPAKAAELPLQRLVLALGNAATGDSTSRYRAAAGVVHAMDQLSPPALRESRFMNRLRTNKQSLSEAYLVHELMTEHWQPLDVIEVRSAMATIGLAPVGSATLVENFDSFVLGSAARDLLSGISDPDVRELARDVFIQQSFRRDVFVRGARPLDGETQRQRLMAASYALLRPAGMIEYAAPTPAGRLNFDSAAARAIVAGLAAGPSALATIVAVDTEEQNDVLASALALAAAGMIVPVEAGGVDVGNVNRAIRSSDFAGVQEILRIALPCGTAISLAPELERSIREGNAKASADELTAWRAFFASHGLDLSRNRLRPQQTGG
jgi:SAM-dependent methyltransferase